MAKPGTIFGFLAYQAQYLIASEALRRGNLKAAAWFPEGCYPAALPFVGPPPPKRPPWRPTRRITKLDSGAVERSEIPVVEIAPAVESRASELGDGPSERPLDFLSLIPRAWKAVSADLMGFSQAWPIFGAHCWRVLLKLLGHYGYILSKKQPGYALLNLVTHFFQTR